MEARGVEPNVISYSAAISAREEGQQWEPAQSLLGQMEARGVEPNVISYNAAISACENGHQWEPALSLLRQKQERGKVILNCRQSCRKKKQKQIVLRENTFQKINQCFSGTRVLEKQIL